MSSAASSPGPSTPQKSSGAGSQPREVMPVSVLTESELGSEAQRERRKRILDATLASAVIVLVLIWLTRNRLPWRYVPGTEEAYSGQDLDKAPHQPPAPAPAPGLYAESP